MISSLSRSLLPWCGFVVRSLVWAVVLVAIWGSAGQSVFTGLFFVLLFVVSAALSVPMRPLLWAIWVSRRSGISVSQALAYVCLRREWDRMLWRSSVGAVREDERQAGLVESVVLRGYRQDGETVQRPDEDRDVLVDFVRLVLVVATGWARWSDFVRYSDVPRIVRASVTKHGVDFTVSPAAKGQTAADLGSSEAIARVESSARLVTGCGGLVLRASTSRTSASVVWSFVWADPLAVAVPVPPVDLERSVDPTAPVPIGLHESGGLYGLQVYGKMTLLVGGTGSGKGSVIWSLLLGLAPAIRAGVVRVHGIDLKGGVEFTTGVDLFHQVAYTYAEAKDLLAGLEDALEQRLAHMVESGSRKHVPSADHPLELLVVDEAASLTYLAPDTATSKKVDAHLKRILSTGRAAGFSVLAAMQDPRKESLSTRDLFSNQIALRLRTEDDARLALGAWAVDAGAQAHMIPETQQGTGYGIDSETSEIVRFRAFWCSDDAVRGVAAEVTLSFMEGADDEF